MWGVYSFFYDLALRNLFPYRQLLDDLNTALAVSDGESVLDAGCGSGAVIEKVVRGNKGKTISITGVDSSRGMIRRAGRRCRDFPNVRFLAADLNTDLEFPDGCFDKVVCSNVLYALKSPEGALSEFYRVLRPGGGTLVIANPRPGAGEKELVREHLRVLRRLVPIHRRIHHALISILLIPVNLVVATINRIILDRAESREYHFLDDDSLSEILRRAGFTSIEISYCYADQDWLVTAKK
ncbi:MAG: class I SAM-dependent methyltransferase [Dehalococcoidia bacterium]